VLLHALADYHFHVPAVSMLVVILVGLAVGMESGDRYSLRIQMQRRTQIALATGLIVIAVAGAWHGWRLVTTNQLLKAADSLKETADFDQARQLYQKVLRQDAGQYGAHKGLGDIDLALATVQTNSSVAELRNDLARRAVDAYRASLILNPYDSDVQLGLAKAFEYLNDRVQSLAAADRALALDPNRLEVLRATGLLCFRAGQRDKALPLLMKAQSVRWAPDVNAALEAMKTSH
jgi:tetratricopeptide (TPR) repeat protein